MREELTEPSFDQCPAVYIELRAWAAVGRSLRASVNVRSAGPVVCVIAY